MISLPGAAFEPSPPTQPAAWADYSRGVYRLEKTLLVVLDVERLLAVAQAA